MMCLLLPANNDNKTLYKPLSLTKDISIMEDIRLFCSVNMWLSWYISPSKTKQKCKELGDYIKKCVST